jgi:5-formyltetrahydrofolate cyclo-ligase
VQTLGLISTLLSEGKRVIVPIIEQQTVSLRLSYLNDITTLMPSTFHVPEPVGYEIPARPDEVQVAVIPMLAFDARGNRIGYGAGYYDRFLKQCPWITKIGIAFSCQQAEYIPAESDDIAMDYIVTEDAILSCSR